MNSIRHFEPIFQKVSLGKLLRVKAKVLVGMYIVLILLDMFIRYLNLRIQMVENISEKIYGITMKLPPTCHLILQMMPHWLNKVSCNQVYLMLCLCQREKLMNKKYIET